MESNLTPLNLHTLIKKALNRLDNVPNTLFKNTRCTVT